MRDKNCGNCAHCFANKGNIRRFKCMYQPCPPDAWWNGLPSDHWCVAYWKAKEIDDIKKPITVRQEK